MKFSFDNNTITALSTVCLVLVGYAQLKLLFAQKRQSQLTFVQYYREQWTQNKDNLGLMIYIGRDENEYYQLMNQARLKELSNLKKNTSYSHPTTWALEATRQIFSLLSEISIQILKGNLETKDVYSIFGTELLRQSRPIRVLLDVDYKFSFLDSSPSHIKIRKEIQDWLIYHDGIRRRCLILIDLLWAEAARLEDLPPMDLKSAADAKRKSGKINRKNLIQECIRLNGLKKIHHVLKLANFLKHSEYRKLFSSYGLNARHLKKLNKIWEYRLLRDYRDTIYNYKKK